MRDRGGDGGRTREPGWRDPPGHYDTTAAVPPAARQVSGALMICLGIALLAMWGFGGGPMPWLDVAALALVIVGASMSGLLRFTR